MKNALRSLMVGAFAGCSFVACGGVQNDSTPPQLVEAYDRLEQQSVGESIIMTESSELTIEGGDDQIRYEACADPSEVWAKRLGKSFAEVKVCNESLYSIMNTPYDPKDTSAPMRLALRETIALLLNVIINGTAIGEKSVVLEKATRMLKLIEDECKIGVPNNKVFQVVVMDYLKKYNLGEKNASGELFTKKCSYGKSNNKQLPDIR